MLKVRYSNRFKKDYKTILKRGYDVKLLEEVIRFLVEEKPLPLILYRPQTGGRVYRLSGMPYYARLVARLQN